MTWNLERDTLLESLQTVIGVVERRQTLPILANVLIIAKADLLSVMATDMEVSLLSRCQIPAVAAPLKCTASGRKLLDMLRAIPPGTLLTLALESEQLRIKIEHSRFVLATLPVETFPRFEAIDSCLTLSFTGKKLHTLLQSCAFAMAQQDLRYYLNGMLLEIKNEKLSAVATDGHRFAMFCCDLPDIQQNLRVILPRRAVTELLRLLKQDDTPVQLALGKKQMGITHAGLDFHTRLMEGGFPEYEQLLTRESGAICHVDKASFKEALKRVSILSNERFRSVSLKFSKGTLKLLACNTEQEEAEEVLSVEYDKAPIEIAFNISYLLDAIGPIAGDRLKLTITDSLNRMFIEDAEPSEQLFIVMPLQL